jgi:transposase
MARPKKWLDEVLGEKARKALEETQDTVLLLRLKAIRRCLDMHILAVARGMGCSRKTLERWIRLFHKGGLEGLKNRPKGHNPSKLTPRQESQLSGWIERSQSPAGKPIHWTLLLLRQAIRERFGVEVGMTPLWLRVRRLGFRQKTPRPSHASANPKKQNAFKKKPWRRFDPS